MSNKLKNSRDIVIYAPDDRIVLETPSSPPPIIPLIPGGVYNIKLHVDPIKSFYYLQRADSFDIPEKVYGDMDQRAKTIIKTFKRRDVNTGVLLSGNKGAGKTMLGRLVCSYLEHQDDMPILNLNDEFSGAMFNEFMNKIHQPCVVFCDEFEKMYKTSERDAEESGMTKQEQFLSLLDGTSAGKKLYILTGNDTNKVNNFMIDRPGRIYYHYKYDRLDDAIIEGYLQDNLVDQSDINTVKIICSLIRDIGFDALTCIVDELNSFKGDTIFEVLDRLNVSVGGSDHRYRVTMFNKNTGEDVPIKKPPQYFTTPATETNYAYINMMRLLTNDSKAGGYDATAIYYNADYVDKLYSLKSRLKKKGYDSFDSFDCLDNSDQKKFLGKNDKNHVKRQIFSHSRIKGGMVDWSISNAHTLYMECIESDDLCFKLEYDPISYNTSTYAGNADKLNNATPQVPYTDDGGIGGEAGEVVPIPRKYVN